MGDQFEQPDSRHGPMPANRGLADAQRVVQKVEQKAKAVAASVAEQSRVSSSIEQAEANQRQAEANLKQAQANLLRDTAEQKNAEAEANRYAQLFNAGVAAAEQERVVARAGVLRRDGRPPRAPRLPRRRHHRRRNVGGTLDFTQSPSCYPGFDGGRVDVLVFGVLRLPRTAKAGKQSFCHWPIVS